MKEQIFIIVFGTEEKITPQIILDILRLRFGEGQIREIKKKGDNGNE